MMYLNSKNKTIGMDQNDFNDIFIPRYKSLIFITCKRWGLDYFYQDRDELLQIGLLALWDAYTNYNKKKGATIRTFIINTIWYHLHDNKYLSQGYTYKTRAQFNRALRGEYKDGTTLPSFCDSDSILNLSIPSDKYLVENTHDLDILMSTLNARESYYINSLLSGKNIKEIAEIERLSSERVKQVINGAKKKMESVRLNDEEALRNPKNKMFQKLIKSKSKNECSDIEHIGDPIKLIVEADIEKPKGKMFQKLIKSKSKTECSKKEHISDLIKISKTKQDCNSFENLPEEDRRFYDILVKSDLDLNDLSVKESTIVIYLLEGKKISFIMSKFKRSRRYILNRLETVIANIKDQ